MKVIKALKKLKLWSRKKKKYRLLGNESPPPPSRSPPPPSRPPPPPPPSYYSIHSHYEQLLPSAPPLPPWLEYDMQFQDIISTSEVSLDDSVSKPDFPPPELEANASCYHQYLVYSDSNINRVAQLEKLERRQVGAFGSVVSFAVHLLLSVFPCFHIREETAKLK